MKTPGFWAAPVFCIAFSSLWAGPTEVNTGRSSGGTGVNTGLPASGGSVTGNNTGLGSGSIQPMTMGGAVKTLAPTPQVENSRAKPSAAVLPAGHASQALVAPGAVQQPAPAAPASAQSASEALTPAAGGKVMAAPASGREAGPQAAGQALREASRGVRAGKAGEAQARGEESMGQALDRIFDASFFSRAQLRGPDAGVKGAVMQTKEKIKKTASLANTSSPRDAPELYASAVKLAEDSFPAKVAQLVRATVLGYAATKAATALPDLANDAYRSAAAGVEKDVRAALKALDQWEKLLASPQHKLVTNAQGLKRDVERVLGEGAKAASSGKTVSAPRIWFSKLGRSFTAILPAAAVAAVPADLAKDLALKDAMASLPFAQGAYVAFQARPSAFNGARIVFAAHPQARASLLSSAFFSASYAARTILARLWRAIKDIFRRLLGRASGAAVSRGFIVESSPAALAGIEAAGRRAVVAFQGTRLAVSKTEISAAPWQRSLSALSELQAAYANAQTLLARQSPLDLAAARSLLGQARIMAAAHDRISFDSSATAVVDAVSRRLESVAREQGLGPASVLPADLERLLRDEDFVSLRHWIARMRQSGQDHVLSLSGRAPANLLLASSLPGAGKRWALTDLDESLTTRQGLLASYGVRAATRLFLDAPAAPEGSFVAMDRQLLARWGRDGRYAKAYADFSPTERGGGVRILYEDASGVSAAAGLLSGLGFSVTVRGQSLSASLDDNVAAAGTEELVEAFSRAVNLLQFGRDPGRVRPPAGDARRDVAKLISEIKNRRAEASSMAEAVRSLAYGLRFVTVGRVGRLYARRARLAFDDGRVLRIYVLQEPESGLFSAARVEWEGSAKALSVPELRGLPRGQ